MPQQLAADQVAHCAVSRPARKDRTRAHRNSTTLPVAVRNYPTEEGTHPTLERTMREARSRDRPRTNTLNTQAQLTYRNHKNPTKMVPIDLTLKTV